MGRRKLGNGHKEPFKSFLQTETHIWSDAFVVYNCFLRRRACMFFRRGNRLWGFCVLASGAAVWKGQCAPPCRHALLSGSPSCLTCGTWWVWTLRSHPEKVAWFSVKSRINISAHSVSFHCFLLERHTVSTAHSCLLMPPSVYPASHLLCKTPWFSAYKCHVQCDFLRMP